MSETNINTNPVESQAGQTRSDIETELNRLGENLGKLLKSVWESEERKSVEREIRNGLEEFNKQINKAVEQARSQSRTDESVRKAKDSVKSAWETAHGPQVLNEMRLGLVDSLRKLNDELARRAEAKPAQEVKADMPGETPMGDVPTRTEMGNPPTDPVPVENPKIE